MIFTTVVEKVSNRLSLSSEVAGDISLIVSNGYRNLLSEGTNVHPGVHIPEPSLTKAATTIPGSKISPTVVRKESSALSLATAFSQSLASTQRVTENVTIESIVGF